MEYTATQQLAWESAMEHVEDGHNFACIPVVLSSGERCVWTIGLEMPTPKDDMDVLAQAFVAINQARDQAQRHGLHPVDWSNAHD